jgi:hypothetical protein
MRRSLINILCVLIVVFAFLLLAVPSAKANVLTTNDDPRPKCGHLQIYLNGPINWVCRDQQVASILQNKNGVNSSIANPGIVAVTCDANSLVIWADTGFSGWTICFKGAGSTDMTSYCGPAPWGCTWNWNDNASSFATGCSPASFYKDIGDSGQREGENSFQRQNFDGQNGRLPNDTLSSVSQPASC